MMMTMMPASRRQKFALVTWTLAGVAVVLCLASCQGVGWSLMNRKVRSDFPTVRRTGTGELAGRLNDPRRPRPVLLDVRTQAEYDVSHLPGARRVEPGSDPAQLSLPKDQPVVTYCSVGYRSAAFARRMQETGFERVENLEGSIFQWANEGRPLEQKEGQPARQVHPYNATWGLLLDKPLRADVPPAS